MGFTPSRSIIGRYPISTRGVNPFEGDDCLPIVVWSCSTTPDDQLGFTHDLAAVLRERRHQRRVNFTLPNLLTQRMLHIAAGYEDANDVTSLRHDPICKLLLGRLLASGLPLASQPTISRFAPRVSCTEP